MQTKYIERLRVEREQFEQLAQRDNRDAEMQLLMKLNNELVVQRDALLAELKVTNDLLVTIAVESFTNSVGIHLIASETDDEKAIREAGG